MPPPPLAPQRPTIELAGLSPTDLSSDLVSWRFVEHLAKEGLIEATLANWGGSPPGFKHSEGNAVRIGAQVTLRCGTSLLATGVINAVAAHFDAATAPTLSFTAKVARPVSPPAAALALRYGANLLSFSPVEQAGTARRRPPITATGEAGAMPELRAGVPLDVTGLGARWSGSYTVIEATHSFDGQRGHRVAFACVR